MKHCLLWTLMRPLCPSTLSTRKTLTSLLCPLVRILFASHSLSLVVENALYSVRAGERKHRWKKIHQDFTKKVAGLPNIPSERSLRAHVDGLLRTFISEDRVKQFRTGENQVMTELDELLYAYAEQKEQYTVRQDH